MFLKYLLAWFPMILLAIVNGLLREFLLLGFFGEAAAHQISTVTLLLLFALYIGYVVKKIGFQSARQSWLVGAVWLLLTVFFELALGYADGQTLAEMLEAYNVLEGRLWILIPLWVGIAPRLFFLLQSSPE